MKRVAIAFLGVLCLSATPAQEKPAILWAKSWTEALAEAAIRNVPIYYTVHKDGWGECTVVERSTYPNPAVVTASKNLVCVVGHGGAKDFATTHGSKDVKVGTEKVKMCKLYAGIQCTDHVEIFKERAHPVFKNQVFATPHHLYYTPSGEEIVRNFGTKTPQEFAKDFADALAKVSGVHVGKDDYDGAKTHVNQGLDLVKKDEIKKAIAVFTTLTKHKVEMLRPMGTKELDALQASGDARVQSALQTLESNNGEEKAKKELKKVADEYAPLPCAKKAEEVLRLMAEKGR